MKKSMWKQGMAVCLLVLLTACGVPAEVQAETGGRQAGGADPAGKVLAGEAGSALQKLSDAAEAVIREAGETVKAGAGRGGDAQGGETDTAGQEEKSEEEKKEEAAVDAYFSHAVFVGDSIMLGFRNYAMKRQDTFLSSLDFLAAGSFSASNALWPVDEKSVHPVYQGEQRPVWDSIALMKGEKVFLMLGMNDLNVYGLEGSLNHYRELAGHIADKNPAAEIHIMSMTYVLKGKEAAMLKNGTIRQYNEMLRQMAEENGWGYVELAEALSDGGGNLAPQYCSDGFVHQNPEAYDVWVSVLRGYAGERLKQPAGKETAAAAQADLKEKES